MSRRLSFARLNLQQQPLVFLTTAFTGGLLLAARFPLSVHLWLAITISLWLIVLVCWCCKVETWVITVLLLCGCAGGGGALWARNEANVRADSLRRLLERGELSVSEPVEIWGKVNTVPELAPDRIYLSLTVERVTALRREQPASGVVRLVVPFHESEARAEYDMLKLDYGTSLRVLAQPMNAHGYRNPGAPDFDELLELRGYDATATVKSPLLIEKLRDEIPTRTHERLLYFFRHLRARAITVILRNFRQPTAGLLTAALFGNRYFLSHDTAEAFRAGGTFHFLVISGLHVAMLAAVALWLINRLRVAAWLQFSLVNFLMWSYALMVGAQPSVMRAVVMLTIVLLRELLFRAGVGASTLAAAALAMLVWQPRDLFNPSFQLSFLTVLLIVLVAVPMMLRLRYIGAWQPSALTPYPPRCPVAVRWLAELLFWNEKDFRTEMANAPIRYRLEKAAAARWLSRSHFGRLVQQSMAAITGTLLTTMCIQVGLLPLMVTYFHRISFVAPLANVIESLLMFVTLVAGGVYLMIYALSPDLAWHLTGAVNAIGSVTVKLANPISGWRKATMRVPDHDATTAFIIYVSYFLLILLLLIALTKWNPLAKKDDAMKERRKAFGRALVTLGTVCLLTLFALIVWHPAAHRFEGGRLSVTFLDVGQGDAAVVTFPRGAMMLVDSGGHLQFKNDEQADMSEDVFVEDHISIAEAAVAPYLWSRGIKRLDLIVASHADTDHIEGFADIVRSFAIGAALVGLLPEEDERFNLFRQALNEAGVPLRVMNRGTGFELDGVRVAVLAPFADETGARRYTNNQSLVLKLIYGNRSFLLTGDIERKVEERLLAAGDDLRADVLKVAHHGSQTSSTEVFLRHVMPQYAVISVAAPSPFGHPHAGVMERLQQTGARILPTGDCGAITISTDGNDLQASTFTRCAEGKKSDSMVDETEGKTK